ncbi:MAG: cupin domain-containing protein [Prevotella sp.]|jgi:quercetin dioxygenase-like cupin family protein|nr:cupin domain-containing protein [Prevotella sp.]
MNQSDVFLSGKEILIEEVGKGVTRQILGYDNSLMLVKVSFEKGAVGDMHSHPHVQSSYIESGIFEVTIGGEKQTLVKGDGFFIPSGVSHGLICIEQGAVIDCFTPVREDFLHVK